MDLYGKTLWNRFVRRLRSPNHRSIPDRGPNVRHSYGKPYRRRAHGYHGPPSTYTRGRFLHDRTSFDRNQRVHVRPRRREVHGEDLLRREVDARPQVPPLRVDPDLRLVDRQGTTVPPVWRGEEIPAPPVPPSDRLVRATPPEDSAHPPQRQAPVVREDRHGRCQLVRTSPPENPSTPEQFRDALQQVPSLLPLCKAPEGGTFIPFSGCQWPVKLTVSRTGVARLM